MNGINISNKAISTKAAHVISIPEINKKENDNPVANAAFQGSLGRSSCDSHKNQKTGKPSYTGIGQNAKDVRCGIQQGLMKLDTQTGNNILTFSGKHTQLVEKKIINYS